VKPAIAQNLAVRSANEKSRSRRRLRGNAWSPVKNIVRELNNEKVDIIRWSSDVKELVLEALKPAKVKTITLDEGKRNVLIKVRERTNCLWRSVNAAKTPAWLPDLTGWDISIEKDESVREAFEQNVEKGVLSLAFALTIDVDTARKLMESGMNSADVILTCDASDIVDAIGCDPAIAEKSSRPLKADLQIPRRLSFLLLKQLGFFLLSIAQLNGHSTTTHISPQKTGRPIHCAQDNCTRP